MNLVYDHDIITLYHHNTQICLDRVHQPGIACWMVDFKQNIFCIRLNTDDDRFFTIKNGKILKLSIDSCTHNKTLAEFMHATQKCYEFIDNTIIIYSIDHKEEYKIKLDLDPNENFVQFVILDGWYVVYTLFNDKTCTRLYDSEKCYKFKFEITNIVDGLIICYRDDPHVINIKQFINNNDWIERYDSCFSECWIGLFKDNSFMVWNGVCKDYYRVINDKVIEVEPFCELPKLSFSSDYLNKLTGTIKSSTSIIDAIVKTIIFAYWGV